MTGIILLPTICMKTLWNEGKKSLILLFLFRILQIAICSCESQASFQFGVQRLSLCPSSKHTVGAHPQTSALYLLLLHIRRKVKSRAKIQQPSCVSVGSRVIWANLHSDSTHSMCH